VRRWRRRRQIDYYRRLERGDVSGASDSVLEALARALQLDDAERPPLRSRPLRQPGGYQAGPSGCSNASRSVVQRILDSMPTLFRNARVDYLAANQLGRALYAPLFKSREQPASA